MSKRVDGACIAPVILATDKTQLSTFSGDKQAWPVYLTLGNIDKAVRRRPSQRAMVLLGYLPVSKLECFKKDGRSLQGYRLFHFAMQQLLMPLVEAGKNGVFMTCADGFIRHIFPLLAAYIADHPEQCLVCCCKENRCPTCTVLPTSRGELLSTCYRDPEISLSAMRDVEDPNLEAQGLRHIPDPFWADLPYANIFNCIVPDLLHQLHKGVFKDHLVKWTTERHEAEVDARFSRIPPYPGLRVFKNGISSVKQWTGNEYRQMEKVFIGVLCGLHKDPRVIAASRAILDFIYLAHYPSHTLSTLQQMKEALEDFHRHKSVFIELGIRKNFNIPKLHWMSAHYIASIIDFGSCDGLSTETPERLHIDFAKCGYRASNRKAYIKQMVTWLTRRDKVRWFEGYLQWARVSAASIPGEVSQAAVYEDEVALRDEEPAPSGTLDEPHRPATAKSGSGSNASTDSGTFTCQPSEAIEDTIDATNDQGLTGAEVSDSEDEDPDMEVGQDSLFGVYQVSRKPGLGRLSGDEMTVTFGNAFNNSLMVFLRSETGNTYRASEFAKYDFSLFRQFKRKLPSLRGGAEAELLDTVRACPAQGQRPALYSTILYVEDTEVAETLGVDGYRVAQVRAIFMLPPALQRLRPLAHQTQSHLAFIEVFTAFDSVPDKHSKLYRVDRLYSNMVRKTAVIPVTSIFRSCHLIPDWGESVNRSWTSESVLEQCQKFFLNAFCDHHMYLFV